MLGAIDDHYGEEQIDGGACERVLRAPHYVQGGFDDPETYRRLAAVLDELDRHGGTAGNRVFYLATPPSQFPVIVRGLAAGGLARRGAWAGGPAAAPRASAPGAAAAGRGASAVAHAGSPADPPDAPRPGARSATAPGRPVRRRPLPTSPAPPPGEPAAASVRGWTRIVVEKPFGRDLASAAELNAIVREVFDERQVYRIDHYLAKETVQNLLVLRFANTLFEPIWNRRYVDHVQITAAETLGVEHRGTYYEEAGALRDMIKPHLIQLFALVAMEPPVTLDAEAIRDEKLKLLRAVRPIPRDRVDLFAVRGQYVRGVIDGGGVSAYREEPKVAPDSITETYAALKLLVDNWRWQGVPFYLRTGKRLARRVTEIAIQFRKPPVLLFRDAVAGQGGLVPDQLVLRVQPDEGVFAAHRVQGARAGGRPAARVHGLLVRQQPARAALQRLRDRAGRRDAGRHDAVQARRPGRGGVGHHGAGPRGVVGGAARQVADLRSRDVGAGGRRRARSARRQRLAAPRVGARRRVP